MWAALYGIFSATKNPWADQLTKSSTRDSSEMDDVKIPDVDDGGVPDQVRRAPQKNQDVSSFSEFGNLACYSLL